MLKYCLRRECVSARVSGAVDVPFAEFMRCIARAMQHSLDSRDWAAVFDRVGYGSAQTGVSPSLLLQLDSDAILGVGCERPGLRILAQCFPKRAKVLEHVLWKRVDLGAVAAARKIPTPPKKDSLQEFILPDGAKRCHAETVLKDGAKKRRRT